MNADEARAQLQRDIDRRILAHNRMMGIPFDQLLALFQAWFNREHGGHMHASEFSLAPGPEFRFADREVDDAWTAFHAAYRMCLGHDADLVLAERDEVTLG